MEVRRLHRRDDELITYKATEANQKSDLLKQELHRINEQIIALEDKAQPG
jgi:hypothetical protein